MNFSKVKRSKEMKRKSFICKDTLGPSLYLSLARQIPTFTFFQSCLPWYAQKLGKAQCTFNKGMEGKNIATRRNQNTNRVFI